MPAVKSASLCWGQHHHLLRYLRVPVESRHEAHITTTFPLPDGCTTAHVRETLTYLVRRHEVLRTVYELDAYPGPRQRVEPPAPLPVHEATTEDDGTPSPTEVIRELTETAFDLTRDWPMRACVVTTGGQLKRLHLVFNHLSFDDVSLDVLADELAAVLLARTLGRPVTLPAVRHQPVDLARYEATRPPAAVEATLDHWRTEVSRLPADVYARRRRQATTGAHSASYTVPSLLGTARTIAGRQRVWPSAVHLAAYAVTMAAYTGERLIAHRMYTSQRDASGYHSVVTCLSYPTLVAHDLADDPTFSEVLRRAADRVEQSIAYAHVPHARVVELLADEGYRRGQSIRVSSELNFLDNAPRSCRTTRDRLAWNSAPTDWATAGSDLYFRIYEWADGITLALQALDEVMDRDAVERFLRGYARLLDAHREPGVDLRVSEALALLDFAPAPDRALLRVGPDAVDAAQTEAALCAHPGVHAAHLAVTERGLLAEVRVECSVTPIELRAHVLGVRPDVRCPDWFRVTTDESTVEGDGRTRTPSVPGTPAEHALTSIVAEANGLPHVDPAHSYTTAGGRALRLPVVLTTLRERGWDGVSLGDLISPRPLRALADRLEQSRRPVKGEQ